MTYGRAFACLAAEAKPLASATSPDLAPLPASPTHHQAAQHLPAPSAEQRFTLAARSAPKIFSSLLLQTRPPRPAATGAPLRSRPGHAPQCAPDGASWSY